MSLKWLGLLGILLLLAVNGLSHADNAEPIADLGVTTGIPFGPHYDTTFSVETGANGDLEFIDFSGNIPGMVASRRSVADFLQTGFSSQGPKGTALAVSLSGSFTQHDGGGMQIRYLDCASNQMKAFSLAVEHDPSNSAQAPNSWELAQNNQKVFHFTFTAQVGISGWTGCFTSVKVTQ